MSEYIDLSIIDSNLRNGYYNGTFSFIQDMKKMWLNAFNYLVETNDQKRKLDALYKKFQEDIGELEMLPIKEILHKKDVGG
mmetsp:Transcript_18074/g.17246  ORF Transcript_18074/g.17246 Transcript_18074/m.17246 type:complete len:81 (+) Transcript_18074:271-513(+)